MNIEIILLGIACSMTLLAYMVAINAHGPTRLSLSYFLATVMLAGNVWGVIQYVNNDRNKIKMEEMKRLEAENRIAEEKILEQERSLKAHKEELGMVASLNPVINTGIALASSLLNANFQDGSMEIDALIARASESKIKVEKLKEEYLNIKFTDTFLPDARQDVYDAIQLLGEAALNFRSYYNAEDTNQEVIRERVVRQKAKLAYEKFKSASNLISSLRK
ncbi:MAG TPA: hypothetical protein VHP36_07060 [Chitinispirillaceae bacterium]|nr:hypothetical protein [Chitinispirillaceae bacterium]